MASSVMILPRMSMLFSTLVNLLSLVVCGIQLESVG
jgi:hypothetical protein